MLDFVEGGGEVGVLGEKGKDGLMETPWTIYEIIV